MSMSERSADDAVAFYDILAAEYDAMTDFEGRFERERSFFSDLVDEYSIGSALDAGCGTGFHAFLLSRLGVRSAAVDSSAKMIESVKRHAHTLNLSVTALRGPLAEIPSLVPGPFDAVFCMGNTLAHLRNNVERIEVFTAFSKVLRPGGVCIVQVLNYLRKPQQPVRSEREAGGKRYIRTHTRSGQNITFTITIEPVNSASGMPSTMAIQLTPVQHQDLCGELTNANFTVAASFGNIFREPYHPETSTDIIVIGRKTA
jgi:glycine/sarcosine N-methyltransferase